MTRHSTPNLAGIGNPKSVLIGGGVKPVGLDGDTKCINGVSLRHSKVVFTRPAPVESSFTPTGGHLLFFSWDFFV